MKKLTIIGLLFLSTAVAFAGTINIKVGAGVKTFTPSYNQESSQLAPNNPRDYCVNKGGQYFDVEHNDLCNGGPMTMEEFQVAGLDELNELLSSFPTYTMVRMNILKVNNKTAPKSCIDLSGYDYKNNHSYTITINTNGCSVSD